MGPYPDLIVPTDDPERLLAWSYRVILHVEAPVEARLQRHPATANIVLTLAAVAFTAAALGLLLV
jgi:hypothetical protein